MNKSKQKKIIDHVVNLSETTPFSIDQLLMLADRIASLASAGLIDLEQTLENLRKGDH